MAIDTDVRVPAGTVELAATLVVPEAARGAVLFAHGSGSSRHSPRNRAVAGQLNAAGYATILLDLLTAAEDEEDQLTRRHRFDVVLLGERLGAAVDWACEERDLVGLPLGLFGASTGAAAALLAAAARPHRVAAVVSRGGRPDLAGAALNVVQAPTLLIVGGEDREVLAVNRDAARAMGEVAEVTVVPGATHLFAEPGTLDQVVCRARTWFDVHLCQGTPLPDRLHAGGWHRRGEGPA